MGYYAVKSLIFQWGLHEHEEVFHDVEAFLELEVGFAEGADVGGVFFGEGVEEVLVVAALEEALGGVADEEGEVGLVGGEDGLEIDVVDFLDLGAVEGGDVREVVDEAGRDLVGLEGVFGEAFAELEGGEESGDDDVGQDADELGAFSRDGVVAAAGDFVLSGGIDAAVVGGFECKGLEGSFSVGFCITDDEGASIFLEGLGDDFSGRGAGFIGEDDKGSVPGDFGFGVAQFLNGSGVVFDGDDDAFFNEESGNGNGLRKKSSGVIAKIEDEAGEAVIFF